MGTNRDRRRRAPVLPMHLAPFRKPARLAVGFGPKELPYRMAPDTPQKWVPRSPPGRRRLGWCSVDGRSLARSCCCNNKLSLAARRGFVRQHEMVACRPRTARSCSREVS